MRRTLTLWALGLLLTAAAVTFGGSALTGTAPADFYKDLLHLDNSNAGVTSSLQTLVDGAGNDTGLSISTTGIGAGSFKLLSGANELFANVYNDGTDDWWVISAEDDTDGDGKLSLGELQVGGTASGLRLKDNSGDLYLRNAADSAYADLRAGDVLVNNNLYAYKSIIAQAANRTLEIQDVYGWTEAGTSLLIDDEWDVDDADAAGESVAVAITPTYDIEDAGDDHPTVDLLIDRTETNVDADVDNELIAARVGGTDKFTVDNTGGITAQGVSAFAGNVGAAPPATCTAGTFWIDTDETDDTNCTTTNDNSLCLCVATDTWVAFENN